MIGLTLAILAVLVSSSSHSRVNVVASGAVRWRAVGLRGGEATDCLCSRLGAALAAAGWNGAGRRGVQGAVQRRNGEVVLRLRGNSAGVAEDAHHLQVERRRDGLLCNIQPSLCLQFTTISHSNSYSASPNVETPQRRLCLVLASWRLAGHLLTTASVALTITAV